MGFASHGNVVCCKTWYCCVFCFKDVVYFQRGFTFLGKFNQIFFCFLMETFNLSQFPQSSWVESWISISRFNSSQGFVWTTSLLWGIWHFHSQLIEWGWWVWKPGWWEGWGCIRASKQRRHCGRCTPALSCIKFNTHNNSKRFWLVVITCSKKAPERVQAAAEYLPIVSKHRTQINLSSPKKAEIRDG